MGDKLFLPTTTPETDRWLTPRWVLDALGAFDLDPCGAPGWKTADEVWTPEEVGDGLALPWRGRVWLNPPYGSAMSAWLQRMAEHGQGIALIFGRTDTANFHEHVFPHAKAILFVRGRLTFLKPDLSSPVANSGAPSVLIAYNELDAAVLEKCGIPGKLLWMERVAA